VARYLSSRHQRLMDESEQALSEAADRGTARSARIARHILSDKPAHRLWESRHADLVLPIARTGKRNTQIFWLRQIAVGMLHQRALIDYIRRNEVTGVKRQRLLAEFYGPKATTNAILAEHKRYMLAVSSKLSADHIIRLMQDPVSLRLLSEYRNCYERYFDLYCYSVTTEDPATADATRSVMRDSRMQAKAIYERIKSERPASNIASFDRQAILARSGRYPIVDYMVG